LSSDIDAGRDFLNKRRLQIGHVLPLNDKLFNQYFPIEQSFLLYHGKKAVALFSYSPGSHKGAPNARFRVVSDSRLGLLEAVFEGNESAERLYTKAGFVECGKVPEWLQEGYVNETYMTLKLG
jgi:hypothetical protein